MDFVDLDFNQAKTRHILFKTKLRSILYGAEIDEAPVLSHNECGVGEWIYDHALQAYPHIPEMLELERVHARIHACARELIALYRSGHVEEARNGLVEMDSIAAQLIALLETIEKKIKAANPVEENSDLLQVHSSELLQLHKTIRELDERIREQIAITQTAKKTADESTGRFRNTVQQAPVGIAILRGRNFVVEMANSAYLEMVDRQEIDLIGKPILDSLPEVRETVEHLWLNVLNTGEAFHLGELAVSINRFGKQDAGYFNIVYHPLRQPDGTVDGIIVVATEVTEIVRSKQFLERSELQFRNLIAQSPIAMTILKGEDFTVDIANETLLKNIWRKQMGDVHGKKLLEIFPELKDQKFPQQLREVYASGIPYRQVEAPLLIISTGVTRKHYIDYEFTPLLESDKTVSGIMATIYDVTEKVEAREQANDAAERLLLATEGTQLATWDLNLQTRAILHSPRLAVIFGFDKTKTLSHPEMRSHIHPDDRQLIVVKAFDKALSTGSYFYESRIIHPDRTIHWIRTNGKVMFGKDHEPLRMVGTMVDITDEKTYQQRQEEDKERLNLVIATSELGIWETDLVNNVSQYSKRYLEIFGLQGEETTSEAVLKKIPKEFQVARLHALEDAKRTGFLYLETPVKWHDGTSHWIEAKGKVMYDGGVPIKMIGTVRDTSLEKEIRHRIEESERRFRSMADTAPVLIWMATPDKLCHFFNKAWLQFTGRTLDQEAGNGWAEGVHPDDLNQCMDVYVSAFDKREEFFVEYRLRRHDGQYRWISNNAVPRFTAGVFEGYIGACMDVHDRKIFEENLKESESRLRIAALSSELGTWSFHPKTRELVWDEQSRALFDLTPEASVDLEVFWSRVHPEDREPSLIKMRRALDPAIAETYDMEYRTISPDSDRIKWIHAKGKAFFDDNNDPYLFSGTILDITEKRLAIAEVLESEEKFRFLANAMPQLIWTGDETGTLNYFNEAVYQFSGLTKEQISKDGWLQIVHPDDQEQNIAHWVNAIATGENFLFEHRFRRHDGQYRWQLSRAIPQRNADGRIQIWIGTSTDIHDRKVFTDELESQVEQRTKELKISVEELRKTNSELEQFAYVASHDLQEPLRKIQTFATRILEVESDKLSPKGQDYLGRLQASSKRMQQLILDLLSFSRASTSEKHFEVADLNLLLEKVKDQLSELIDKNKVTIQSTILPDLRVIVFQFEQLLANLIGNAIKFAKKDVQSRILITSGFEPGNAIGHVAADAEKNYHVISVSDNGIGFDQQFSERIFQVFQRLHGRDSYEGTGIGLAICKRIAENLNGFIVAKGVANEGATFKIYVPEK